MSQGNQPIMMKNSTNEEINDISKINIDLIEGIASNFTNDSIQGALTYNDIDRQILFTMEKNLASLDPEQWLTYTAIETYMTSFGETTTLYILPSI